MRKRAQSKTVNDDVVATETPKNTTTSRTKKDYKKLVLMKGDSKKWQIAALAGIFILVLILNSYFIVASGSPFNENGDDLSSTYYLSGPDPYYNMRLVEETVETGQYQYYGKDNTDPLLNYAIGRSGSRAPLMNMMAIGFGRALSPFVGEEAGLGLAMQFMPALFGALLIIPVFLLGRMIFGDMEGLVAALFVALIPIHIGSGHGSAYALFDHDSFNLFFFAMTFYFVVACIKEKDRMKSRLYALLGGVSLAAVTMTWVEARFIYAALAVYIVVQTLLDIASSKTDRQFAINMPLMFFSGYLISLPVLMQRAGGFQFDFILMMCIGILVLSLISLGLQKLNIPWVLSIPGMLIIGGAIVGFLYFVPSLVDSYTFLVPFNQMSEIIFGSGIYGDKVDLTIAEAGTFSISRTVMSFGPVLYWMSWFSFALLLVWYLRKDHRRDYVFLMSIFLIDIWLTATAGRFLNDLVPIVAILAGFLTVFVISKVDYKMMIKNFKNSGGGLHGFRKSVKIYHILGVLFIAFLIVMPNSFLVMDSAIPNVAVEDEDGQFVSMKSLYFGDDHQAAFGSSFGKESYWIDAFSWLSQQDTEIASAKDRPAVISWWDYGFYEVAVGDHPTVADNFQDGIPPASNFQTALSEKDAVGVWVVRLLASEVKEDGMLSTRSKDLLDEHLGENGSLAASWIENPTLSPSFNAPIDSEFDDDLSLNHLVGVQYPMNAVYQDFIDLITNMTEEQVTLLYHDVQESTGKSVRYFAVEGYDEQIFNIFAFLSDKSLVLYALQEANPDGSFYNPEDEFMTIKYVGYMVNTDGSRGNQQQWTAGELNAMPESQRSRVVVTSTNQEYKEDYYNTMFYKTYVGQIPTQLQNFFPQLPTWGMEHFYAEFVSDVPYSQNRMAVVIAKYYEGASVNGSVLYQDSPLDAQIVVTKPVEMYGTTVDIDHASVATVNGSFDLLAGAGNVTVQIRRYPELGPNAFLVEEVTFNGTGNLAPITDDEAMRIGSHSRDLGQIEIESGDIEGYVFDDLDSDGAYVLENDSTVGNVKVTISEVLQFTDEGAISQRAFPEIILGTTGSDGYFNGSDLRPGFYYLEATLNEGVIIKSEIIAVSQGHNFYNVSRPLSSDVSGWIYRDKNENGQYDDGEQIPDDVQVSLTFERYDGNSVDIGTQELIDGSYAFTGLYPGDYRLVAEEDDPLTPGVDYSGELQISLEENVTRWYNLSLDYAPVEVSGVTTLEGNGISDISIEFLPDGLVANNTAVKASTNSSDAGKYLASLVPGKYNISVETTTDDGVFSFEEKLSVDVGSSALVYDIDLTKLSYEVSGTVTYGSTGKKDVVITFYPAIGVENNTAERAETISLDDGSYSVELLPGEYDVEVSQTATESGIAVVYSFSGDLTISTSDLTYPITLVRTEAES